VKVLNLNGDYTQIQHYFRKTITVVMHFRCIVKVSFD